VDASSKEETSDTGASTPAEPKQEVPKTAALDQEQFEAEARKLPWQVVESKWKAPKAAASKEVPKTAAPKQETSKPEPAKISKPKPEISKPAMSKQAESSEEDIITVDPARQCRQVPQKPVPVALPLPNTPARPQSPVEVPKKAEPVPSKVTIKLPYHFVCRYGDAEGTSKQA
jgi:hypothetical protein